MKITCENGRVVITGAESVTIIDQIPEQGKVRREETKEVKGKVTRRVSMTRRNLVRVIRGKKLSSKPNEWVSVLRYTVPQTAHATATTLRRKEELRNYEFSVTKNVVWARYVGSKKNEK